MPIAAIALGSNVGDRWGALTSAIRRLRAEPGLRVLAVSPFYHTPPVDCPPGSQAFLNAALLAETSLTPERLLALLLAIERRQGRVRSQRNAPRTLDLDLLLYDALQRQAPDPILPHPRMHERAFVLVPLAEIAPETVHPPTGLTVRELLLRLEEKDRAAVRRATAEAVSRPSGFEGRAVLVTGSTSGIGLAIAEAFQTAGADVVTHGRRERPGRHIVADLARIEEVDRLAEEAWSLFPQGLDVLICNAGADVLTGEAARWTFDRKLEALWAVDVRATMRLARAIGARMQARGNGVILTMGWDQAETGFAGESGELFSAVKGAVMAFTRSLALSLAPEVRVNGLAPGWIRTAWGETASEVWQERVRRETPLGLWGLPEDVASAALWLASPQAAFHTGQILRVNGGVVR